MGREPSLTLEGALRILGQHELPGIEKLDKVLGGVILAAGVGAGIATVGPAVLAPLKLFAAVWGWLEQKDTAIGLLRGAIAGLSGKLAGTRGRERRELIAAAHTVIVVAAFFEAFREQAGKELYDRLEITEEEKKTLIAQPVRWGGESVWDVLYAAEVPAPSAVRGFSENVLQVTVWFSGFSSDIDGFIGGLAAGENTVINWKPIVSSAIERYLSHFLALAAKVPEFMIWAMLNEGAATRTAVADLRADQAGQVAAVLADGAATRAAVDGLRADMAAALDANRDALGRLAALLALDAGRPGEMMQDLRQSLAWANNGVLTEKIIPEDAQSYAGIEFPTVGESYINPRYRSALASSQTELIERLLGVLRPADELWWDRYPSRDDFDLMLAAYVTSPDATRLPLLLLGHPGAGKSMLTKVFAARLPPSAYTVVRVPLRRVAANAPVRTQIEQALADSTNGRVNSWWQLAAQSQDTIRVVLLDGLDELLQASQDDRSGYLQDVMEFQQHEAEQRQPVVVVVTSRTVVAERVDIPAGTTVVKLDFFEEPDIADWLDRWRRVNAAAVSAGTMRALTAQSVLGTPAPAEGSGETAADREHIGDDYAKTDNDLLPGNGGVRELARQPLLLLMLALYAADPALPPIDPNAASAELYQRLLETFCRREAAKALGPNPPRDEVAKRMRDHLDRLEVAALAMFNRGRQDIGEEELGADLDVLDPRLMDRSRPSQVGQRIIGEFLFVHAPEARVLGGPGTAAAGAGADSGRSARREPPRRSYEFLHATFGEYLVASRVMSELAEAAARSFAGRRGPTEPDDDLLYALLSHQALATSKPTLIFSDEIFTRLGDQDREQMLAVLELLLAGYRRRQGTVTFAAYRPMAADTVRELAFYSANLVALRVWLEPGHAVVPLPRLLGHTVDGARDTPDNLQEQWRSMVMLWKSGLDPDCVQAMLTTVSFSGDEPGVQVSGLVNTTAGWVTGDPLSIVGDILLARLADDRGLEERIRFGTAILNNQLITFGDTSWIDEIASWLIPALVGHYHLGYAWSPPPATTPDEDVAYIAELIFRYLRSKAGGPRRDGEMAMTESLLKLLFQLPRAFMFDSLALTATVLSEPELLIRVPELQDADIYGPYIIFIRERVGQADGGKVSGVAIAAGRQILEEFVTGVDSSSNMSFQRFPWVAG